ncbi:MAG: AIPR family protein [Leptospiraceae bacterium]|nr:AIPR family protein [Leptospiraceae bacterium]
MQVTKHDLEKAFSTYKSWGFKKKEDFFPAIFLAKEFEKSPEEMKTYVEGGETSFGVNAFYFDKDKKNFYLYSFQWTENFRAFKNVFQKLIQHGMESIFSTAETKDNFLLQVRSSLYENQALIERIFIYFVFNGDVSKANNSDTLSSLREDLESKKHFIDDFFKNKEVTLNIDFLSNASRRRGGLSQTQKTHTYSLEFTSSIIRENEEGTKLYLGFLKLYDLYQMYEDMGLRLFEKNIRAGLSPENSPNRSIRKSLKNIISNQEDASNFAFHHNGITLSASHVQVEDGKILITEPRILNGAQTITSFSKFIEENAESLSKANQEKIRSVEVLSKIIHPSPTSSPSFIVNVTINNNRQNHVEPWNLRASDLIQLEFADKFREELGIYYERQENAFGSLSHEDMEELGIEQNKSIQIKKLGQTFLAVQGEIDKIARLRDVFEDEKKYTSTFKEKYLKVDAKKIVLIYKVNFRLGAATTAIIENSPQKYYELFNKSKNLIWSLLIQAILNDPKLDSWIENYGTNLTSEANFTEILRQLADKKVRHILQEIWKDEKYQKNIEDQNYLFLRNKSTFDHGMRIASEKYQWNKLDL